MKQIEGLLLALFILVVAIALASCSVMKPKRISKDPCERQYRLLQARLY